MNRPRTRTNLVAGLTVLCIAISVGVLAHGRVQAAKDPAREERAIAVRLFDEARSERGLEQRADIRLDYYPDDEFDVLIAPEADQTDLAELGGMYRALGFAVPNSLAAWDQPASRALGLYGTGTNELSIRAGELSPDQQMTLVHELGHALVDQHFPLTTSVPTEDAQFAFRALVEGDATVLEQRWSRQQDHPEAPEPNDTYQPLPEPLEVDGILPYLAGSLFVETLVEDQGWDAVNAAYLDPPATAAEVFQPERRRRDGLISVAPPAKGPADSVPLWTGSLGAHHLFMALGQTLDFTQAWTATAAWEADRYRLWADDDRVCISWAVVGRSGTGFADTIEAWATGSDTVTVVPHDIEPHNTVTPAIDIETVLVTGCDPGIDAASTTRNGLDTPALAGALAMRYALLAELDIAPHHADCLVAATNGTINDIALFDVFWLGTDPGDLDDVVNAPDCAHH